VLLAVALVVGGLVLLVMVAALLAPPSTHTTSAGPPSATPAPTAAAPTATTAAAVPPTTPPATTAAKLTLGQKQQVKVILAASITHDEQVLLQGQRILGNQPYPDASTGLAAMDDPTSAAYQFSAWRQRHDPSLVNDTNSEDAFQKADGFYTADTEPDALSTWRQDMIQASSDLGQWVQTAVSWQISEKTSLDLTSAAATVHDDLAQANRDIAAIIATS